MQNIYWYIGLAVIGIGSGAFAIYKKRFQYKPSTLLAFYLFMSGFTWICEFIVLGLFNSYSYKTGVVEDIWAQNLLGHLLLNTTLYPSAAIIIATSTRRKLTIFVYVVFFTLAEYLFIKLGLYEQHWWHYYMTILTVIISMLFAIKWFDRIKQGCKGLTRAVTFLFIALIVVHFPAPILLLFERQHYQLHLINEFYGNLYLSSLIFIFIYHVLESIELALLTCIFRKPYLKVLPFIISIVFQCIFAVYNILITKNNWHIIYSLTLYEMFIGLFIFLERRTLKPSVLSVPTS